MAEKPVDEIIAPISQPLTKQEEPKQIEQAPSFYDKLRIYLLERLDIKLPEIKKAGKTNKSDSKQLNSKQSNSKRMKLKPQKDSRRKRTIEPEDEAVIIQPGEDAEVMPRQVHPTVCLSDYKEHPQGMLLYEGMENRNNIIIDKECTRIGQTDESDAVIGKDTISRFHAVINKEKQEFYIEDLNSTNGTFVNDEVLAYKEKKLLKSNDIVRFADVKYRFV